MEIKIIADPNEKSIQKGLGFNNKNEAKGIDINIKIVPTRKNNINYGQLTPAFLNLLNYHT